MRQGLLTIGICFMSLCGSWLPHAVGCPYCRVGAAGVAEESEASADGWPLKVSGGLDFASSYFFRGYLQADHGLIMQESLNLFTVCPCGEGVIVRPYVSFFNSSHFGSGNPMSGMADAMVGATATWHGLIVDARYAYYNTNPTMFSNVHEVGAKASFDVLTLFETNEIPDSFSLRPFAGIYGKVFDEKGTENAYLDIGFEPAWRFEWAGQKVGVALPLDWGLGVDGYYLNSNGGNTTLGYFSTALTATMSLPKRAHCGDWFLNASVQYLHLTADNLVSINHGNRDAVIGKVGLAFVF